MKYTVPEDLFEIASISDGRLSPDGKYAAYTVRKTVKETDTDRTVIMLYNLETNETRQLSPEGYSCSSIAWMVDGKKVAYLSVRDRGPQIYTADIETQQESSLTNIKQGVSGGAKFSPDGKKVALAVAKDIPKIDVTKPYRLTRAVYRDNNLGYIGENTLDIYVMDLQTEELKQLTEDRFMNSPMSWTPDSKKVIFNRSGDPDSILFRPSIEVIDLNGQMETLIKAAEWKYVIAMEWLSDGKRLCFIGYPSELPHGTQRKMWVLNTETGKCECRTTGCDIDFGWGVQTDIPIALMGRLGISPDDQYAYTQAGTGVDIQIYRVKLEGEIECTPLLHGDGSYILADFRAGKLLYTYSDVNVPSEIGIYDIDSDSKALISAVSAEFAAERPKLELVPVFYKSTDGAEVKSFLLLPPKDAYQAPYPTVTYYHGGPMSAMGNVYCFECQMLANAGYAVFYSNFRGSSGFGDHFSRGIYNGNAGTQELTDTLIGLDKCIEKGLADDNRMGCCGISYGGYMTCWSVGNTDRFKAAVSENPVTNFVDYVYTNDYIWYSLDEFEGEQVHQAYERMLKCSPIFYAHKCKTPILMVQSEQDYRCPAEQTEQFYTAVRLNGCYAEMLRLPNSNHGSSNHGRNIVRRAQNEALLEWFQRYIPAQQRLELAERKDSDCG